MRAAASALGLHYIPISCHEIKVCFGTIAGRCLVGGEGYIMLVSSLQI